MMEVLRDSGIGVEPPRGPELVRKCGPSPEKIHYISEWANFINNSNRAKFESAYHPSVNFLVPGVVSEMILRAALLPDLNQEKILNDITAFALNYGLSSHDLLLITDDLALNVQSEDEFIHTLMTIVCLRVAAFLNDKNLSEGGGAVLPDFDLIVSEVEKEFRAGRVSVKVDEVDSEDADQIMLRASGIPSMYISQRNELRYQNMGGDAALFNMLSKDKMMFNVIVHECVHIYQDMLGEELTYMDAELAAYEAGEKAQYLLEKSVDPFLPDWEASLMSEDRRRLDEFRVETNIAGLICMGYGDALISFEKKYWQEKDRLMNEWTNEIGFELQGYDLGFSREIYAGLLKIKHAYNMMLNTALAVHNQVADRYEDSGWSEQTFNSWLKSLVEFYKRDAAQAREDFIAQDSETTSSAQAAKNYQFSLTRLMTYAYYGDAQLFESASKEYVDAFDQISAALLYSPYFFNGI